MNELYVKLLIDVWVTPEGDGYSGYRPGAKKWPKSTVVRADWDKNTFQYCLFLGDHEVRCMEAYVMWTTKPLTKGRGVQPVTLFDE